MSYSPTPVPETVTVSPTATYTGVLKPANPPTLDTVEKFDSVVVDEEFFFITQNINRVSDNNLMALRLE